MKTYIPFLIVAILFPLSFRWRGVRLRILMAIQVVCALLLFSLAISGAGPFYPCLLFGTLAGGSVIQTLRKQRSARLS